MNTAWAIALADALGEAGVREAVICPGSRSTPLALALEEHPGIATHVHIDERGAAFFALGIGRATRCPAAVLTTSGTAVANLLPACIEAHQANVPLLLLSADRPEELRGRGANQTMDQVGLFSRFVRAEADLPHPGPDHGDMQAQVREALRRAVAWPPGPVHLNQPLRKPLEPSAEEGTALRALREREGARRSATLDRGPVDRRAALDAGKAPGSGARPPGRTADRDLPGRTPRRLRDRRPPRLEGGRGLVVCGPDSGTDRIDVDVPVVADALSGVRFGPGPTCDAADLYLGHVDVQRALRPDWVVQLGRSPTSNAVRAFLAAHPDVPRFLLDASGRGWSDIPGDVTVLEGAHDLLDDLPPAQPPWTSSWRRLDLRAKEAAAQALASAPDAEANWVPAMVAASERLFVGNSLPVRDLERFGHGRRPLDVHANRGVSGIDGTIATAAGIAAAAGPTTAVVGDVAFQHDVGSLALVPDDLRLVVIDNGGGRLFHHLPVSQATPHFERLFLTPPRLDIEKACSAFGLDAVRVSPSRLRDGLRAGVVIVETDGAASARWRQDMEGRFHREAAKLVAETS